MYETYDEIKRLITDGVSLKKVSASFESRHRNIINCDYDVLCVCVPEIKKLAKKTDIERRDEILESFFGDERKIFETVLFAGCLAARKGDYEKTREYLKRMIPLFGSWAHTDTIVPCLKWCDPDKILSDFEYLLRRDGQYETRFYIIYLMQCLSDERIEQTLNIVRSLPFGRYYVDMGAAWLIAEALVKQYEKTLPIIEEKRLPKFVHNKAIQKARESFRISAEQKDYLDSLKIR